jgi:23S rRNA (pseudouridine1915-N3)-methyltransferase
MLDITLLTIGAVKDRAYQELCLEYEKRLRPFARLKIVELSASSFSQHDQTKAQDLEGQRILAWLARNIKDRTAKIYLLAERGKILASPEFAAWIDKTQPLVLVIGGALGFSAELYERYPQLSLSPLTFTHELARVVLLEQLYRAATIINKKSYHY